MYLSPILVVVWAIVTLGTVGFAYQSRRAHNRNRTALRRVQKSLQKLESKNGKLWYEVMKARASGDLLQTNEVTVTNVETR